MVCLSPAPYSHFLLASRSFPASLLANKRNFAQCKISPSIFHGKSLGSQLVIAIHKEGNCRYRISSLGLLLQNPFYGNMGNIIGQLQRILNPPVRHLLMRQHRLNQGLDKYGLTRPIFQQQDAILPIKTKGRIYISLVAIIVDNICKSHLADRRHYSPSFAADSAFSFFSRLYIKFNISWFRSLFI